MPIPLLYHTATARILPAGARYRQCGVQTPRCLRKGANRLALVAATVSQVLRPDATALGLKSRAAAAVFPDC